MNSKSNRKRLRTFIAALVAGGIVGTCILGYIGYRYQQRKDIDAEFRTDLDRLLQTGNESTLSPAIAEQLLANLDTEIEKKSEGDINQIANLRATVAERLSKRFGSSSFDLNKDDNVRLELNAFKHWAEYRNLMIEDYKSNVLILRGYSLALGNLHQRDPTFVENATVRADDGIESSRPNANSDGELLKNLFYGYRNHQSALKDSVQRLSVEEAKDGLLLSFCWCVVATRNQKLTEKIFRYDSLIFLEEHKRCERAGYLSVTK